MEWWKDLKILSDGAIFISSTTGVAKPMGSTFSDCYEGSESNNERNNSNGNDTGRSDLYHASWDPSEAGKYHTDSSQKAAADYSLEEVDEKDK